MSVDLYSIKPLEWDEPDADEAGDWTIYAHVPFGTYQMTFMDGLLTLSFCFDEYYNEDTINLIEGTAEEAKKAAQHHWELWLKGALQAHK
ncbi:MAG: hypothetical protein ACR2NF_05205 [Pirellulales bacterium]